MSALLDILARVPVVPVLVVEDAAQAAPLARALVAGGLDVLEVTLRTPAALRVIEAMRAAVPDATIGAGTLTRPADFRDAAAAGAHFAVTPGFDPALGEAASRAGLPLLPGVMTPSEILGARAAGHAALKFFPAEPAGGAAMLRALAGPFPGVQFCPTGGITRERAPQYLELGNVVCVGGSWLAPRVLIEQGDWRAIEQLAREAAALSPRNQMARAAL
ncbi:MAG TPA: bifunctional 4-hydroxy-2-oxoglutarate aldolase/2-dehydro-3-deoxy-phosphogluconate aldolase [Steroidobacteraceae bacterium]|nr:bifunctional 4-hydroxy-2-oxoglutarate aldolase/2-dehydro-3-deoxy-phosphogluconate aldolase [Steroidobacteraceae bacterium]